MPRLKSIAESLRPALTNGGWIAIAAGSLFCAVCVVLLGGNARGLAFDDLRLVEQLNWALFAGVALATAAALLVLCRIYNSQSPTAFFLLAVVFTFAIVAALGAPANIFLTLGLSLPLYFALHWALAEGRNPFGQPNIPMWSTWAFAAVLFIAFTLVTAYYSILRLRTFQATAFDLGVFAQMFEYLRSTGRMLTTVERNELLTHYAVHVSPIFYLVLPVYMLAPRIETLLVVQAAAVGAGVFAVRGIAQQLFGKSPRLIMLSCLLFVFNPAFASGVLFDFHENKFLTVLVLYAVYFLLKQKMLPLLLFTGLILMVKEDAAIYAGALGLYLLIARRWAPEKERRRVITGVVMIAASVLWFLIAMQIVAHYGEGVMVERLENFFLPNSTDPGFTDVMRVILANMGYVIAQVFTPEKVTFMLWLFLPLGFAPFLRRKGADWILLIPFLVINLLSNYAFQFQIGFQYTFGSFALAIVLALLALRDCARHTRQKILAFAVMASMLLTVPLMAPRYRELSNDMHIHAEDIHAANAALASLPEDAAITATTFLAVHLTRHPRLYMHPNWFGPSAVTEFLVVRYNEVEENLHGLRAFIEAHYRLYDQAAFVRIYRSVNYF